MNVANEAYLGKNATPWMERFFVIGCILITIALSYAISSANELANSLARVEIEVLEGR